MKSISDEQVISDDLPIGQVTEKPLRILMVTGIYPTLHNPHSGTFIKTQVDSLIAAGLEVEIIHPKPGPVFLRYAIAALQVFFKTLTRRFDIVHGHYGQWCLLACMQWTTPVVASFLGSDLLGAVNVNGKRTKKGMMITNLSLWLCNRVAAATVKTEAMKQVTSGDNIIVYPDGVDFELFHPITRSEARASLGWDQDSYYILFGNNPQRPEKNFPLAQTAVECLRAKGINANLVVATGLPQTKLVEYINASNVVILTSFYEGSPNIVKEAMACNVPVVSTNVGDVFDVIGRTKGCKVCSHDPDELADALANAIRHVEPTTGRNDTAYLEASVIAQNIIHMYNKVKSKKQKGKG